MCVLKNCLKIKRLALFLKCFLRGPNGVTQKVVRARNVKFRQFEVIFDTHMCVKKLLKIETSSFNF
jgi:hypothetical protein